MKMKFMPPKPDNFKKQYGAAFGTETEVISKFEFNLWYDLHIKPLFENAREVHSDLSGPGFWTYGEIDKQPIAPAKALLIKIEPLKEETIQPHYIDAGVTLNGEKLYKKIT